MLRSALLSFLVVGWFNFVLPKATYSQGETTSAIVGQVRDGSGAVVAGATVTIVDRETGMRRSAKTDESGRFNFPQLKPGTYSVTAEAESFEARHNDAVGSRAVGPEAIGRFRAEACASEPEH